MPLEDLVRLSPVRGQTTAEAVAAVLRTAIHRGDLRAGEPLRTAPIAAKLGVSRIPVREALQQLSSEGLVTLYPNRGAVVTVLSVQEVEEIYELRQLLEGEALRKHFPRLSEQDLDAAALLLDQMELASDSGSWGKLDRQFQALLHGALPGTRLHDLIRSLRVHVDRYAHLYGLAMTHRTHFESQHRELLRALRAGTVDQAVRIQRQQLGDTATMLTAAMKEQEQRG